VRCNAENRVEGAVQLASTTCVRNENSKSSHGGKMMPAIDASSNAREKKFETNDGESTAASDVRVAA